MSVKFRIKGFVDRRSPALLEAARALEQAKADKALDDLYDRRVAANRERREKISGIPMYLRLAS